jgi:hypothetical protein
MAAMQAGYAPLYFANAVLPDGRLLVEGGEYNNLQPVFTNQGAIYDPVANVWTQVNPPAGWNNIGDSPGIVQPDGVFMMGQGGISSTKQVTFNASNLTWTAIYQYWESRHYSEEGFGLLPNGKILTVDTANIPNSEIYDPATLNGRARGAQLSSWSTRAVSRSDRKSCAGRQHGSFWRNSSYFHLSSLERDVDA